MGKKKGRLKTVFTWFAVGFAVGWSVRFEREIAEQREQVMGKSATTEAKIGQFSELQQSNQALQEKLTAAHEEIERLRQQVAELTETVTEDDLSEINGVGPVYSTRFNEAGIHTFAEVAALSPEQIWEIVGQKVDATDWIEQAKALAE